MKRNYLITVLFLLVISWAFAQTAQKNFINYQGVARDATQEVLVNTNLTLGVALNFGAPDAARAYEEIHTLTTDANGVFNIQIGSGNNVSGDYTTLPWGDSAAFISVSIDGTPVGTTEIMAVPYAISSGDGQQTAAEVPYDNSVSGLTADNAQEAIDALVGGGTVNTDNQNLELTGDVLSIENGMGTVDLNNYRDDDDADPNNELQTLRFDVATNELSLTNGNSVTIPSGGTDADPDPNNEIQDISLVGTEITITGGSTIDLAPIIPPGGTDNQNLELTGDVLSIEGGSGSVDLSNYINDADFDPNNEVDVTAQTGILLGDGADVTGLVGTTEGQVPKWNASSSTWVPGVDETSTGGSGAERLNDLEDAKYDIVSQSLFIGEGAGLNTVEGSATESISNMGAGYNALNKNTIGNFNTAVGHASLENNTTARANTALGYASLRENTIGLFNTAIGTTSLMENTVGSDNTAVGSGSLETNTVGASNTAVGAQSLSRNTTGNFNTAVGSLSLQANTTGASNTAVGTQSLRVNTDGNDNTAVGAQSLSRNTTGSNNTALGHSALSLNTTGFENTAMGNESLRDNTIGNLNTAIGNFSLSNNTVGNENTALGRSALFSNRAGANNTAVGNSSLREKTTGSNNTALGHSALRALTAGDNNMALGYNAQVPNNNGSNQVRIGNTSIAYAGVQVPWTVTSDRRWKTDIQELPYGLNLVNQLRPVDYVRKNNEHQTREIGFIAQEVESVLEQLGFEDQGILTKDDNGFMSLRYNDFIPVLTKAIQEQQTQIQELKTQNNSMQAQLSALQLLVNQLVSQNEIQTNSNK